MKYCKIILCSWLQVLSSYRCIFSSAPLLLINTQTNCFMLKEAPISQIAQCMPRVLLQSNSCQMVPGNALKWLIIPTYPPQVVPRALLLHLLICPTSTFVHEWSREQPQWASMLLSWCCTWSYSQLVVLFCCCCINQVLNVKQTHKP